MVINRRRLTWKEQVEWVLKNTGIDWENLYIVEEIIKDTTPTYELTTQVGEEVVITYEKN